MSDNIGLIVSFPKDKEADPYTNIPTWEDAMQHVKEELAKSIADGGSEQYDLDWDREYNQEWFDNLSDQEQEDECLKAHDRGIQKVAEQHFKEIESRLSVAGSARLPDGTWISIHWGRDNHE
jgi:hypothetical protein